MSWLISYLTERAFTEKTECKLDYNDLIFSCKFIKESPNCEQEFISCDVGLRKICCFYFMKNKKLFSLSITLSHRSKMKEHQKLLGAMDSVTKVGRFTVDYNDK